MGKLTDKVAKGVFWVMLEKCGVQFVHFFVALVLARLLTPNDYGTVALLTVFISISDLLLDCGIGSALVRKKDATEADYNTVFYLNSLIAFVLYVVLFFLAPAVERFYGISGLGVMMRVLALKVLFQGLSAIQSAVLRKRMLFKLSFRITWSRVIVSAVIGIALAFAGYGPWALVWSSTIGALVGMIARIVVIGWRPSPVFSLASARSLFSFGWKMAAAHALSTLFTNIVSLSIGKIYSRADLAFMQKGGHFPKLLMDLVYISLGHAAFPAMAQIQDDVPRLRRAMRRMIQVSTFIVFPMMVGCSVLAEPLMLVLFGERWLPAAPFVRLTCLAAAFRPFDSVNLNALTARGRSDVFLKLMVIRKLICLLILALTIHCGVWTYCLFAAVFSGPVGIFINAFPNRRHLGYTVPMQIRDVLPSLLMSGVMGGAILAVSLLPVRAEFLLVPQIVLGAVLYVALAVAVRYEPAGEILGVASSVLKRRLPRCSAALERLRERTMG